MAAATLTMLNPQTGGTGKVDLNRLHEALQDGLRVDGEVDMYNPHSGGTGKIAGDRVGEALADGLVPVGSHAHAVATTGAIESAARGAAQGASLGFADEIQAGARSLFGDKTYEQYRDDYREGDKAASEAHPVAFGGSELAGGIASSLIPGLGVAKGAKGLLSAVSAGAKLGGISGLGQSEADLTKGDFAGAAKDTIHGAELGGLIGGASHGLEKGIRAGVGKVKEGLNSAFDPTTNTAAAMGVSPKQFTELADFAATGKPVKVSDSIQRIRKDGVLDGVSDLKNMTSNLGGYKDAALQDLQQAVAKIGDNVVAHPQGDVASAVLGKDFLDRAAKLIGEAPLAEQQSAYAEMGRIIDDLEKTGGKVGAIWREGRNVGQRVEDSFKNPMNKNSALEQISREAKGRISDTVQEAANTAGVGEQLATAREKYSAAATLMEGVKKRYGADLKNPTDGAIRSKDVFIGTALSSGAVAAGAPAALAILATSAGTAASSWWRSVSGRLLRAKIGEAAGLGIQSEAQKQAQAVAMGAIPRTTSGVQQWITQHLPMLEQLQPQMAPTLQEIATASQARAEGMVRTLMPQFHQMFAPAEYPSQLDGKVNDQADKNAAIKKIKSLGLPPSQLAAKISLINRDGTLPEEAMTPDEFVNYLDQFTNKAKASSGDNDY